MKKISYRSKPDTPRNPIDIDSEVFNVGSEDPLLRPDGSAGIISPEIRALIVEDDSYGYIEEEDDNTGSANIDSEILEKLNDLFVVTADAMDRVGDHTSADFVDFLIKKYAESKDIDYSSKFNDLLFKINDSSLNNPNGLIIDLVNKYSRKIKAEALKGRNILSAKESAYLDAIKFFNNFFEAGA